MYGRCVYICLCICTLVLVPRPIPSFSMVHVKKWEGLASEVAWLDVTMTERLAFKKSLGNASFCRPHLSYFNRSIVSKPYLRQIVNGNPLNFADLWLAHVHFHPSYCTDKIGHVTSDIRPSCFSCVMLKSWEGQPGDKARLFVCNAVFTAMQSKQEVSVITVITSIATFLVA